MSVRHSRGIGRSKEERTEVEALILKRKRADPELSPIALARRFGMAADRVRTILKAAGLYTPRGGFRE